MKKLLCMAVMAVSAIAFGAELKWIGPSTGGNWNDPQNWDKTPDWAVANDLDFSSLADGATVVNNATTKLKSLTFASNQGEVTISSSGKTLVPSTGTWTIPAGTVANVTAAIGDTWGYNGWTTTVTGGGKLKIGAAWKSGYTSANWNFSAVTVDVNAAYSVRNNTAQFKLSNGAILNANADFDIGELLSESATDVFNLNGRSVTVKMAINAYAGSIRGLGTLHIHSGGRYSIYGDTRWTVGGDLSGFLGTVVLHDADIILGDGVALGGSAAVNAADAGLLTLAGSQTLSSICGSGSTGGISIPENSVLTVGNDATGPRVDVFGARITGAGGLAKGGAEGTLILSGANDYAGATVVDKGTLVIRDELTTSGYPDGLVARFSFDDDWLTDSVGGNNFALVGNTAPVIRRDGTGKYGNYAHFSADAEGTSSEVVTSENVPIVKSVDWTYAVWIRPSTWTVTNNKYFTNPSGGLYLKWVNKGEGRYFLAGGYGDWMWSPGSNHAERWNHFCVTQEGSVRKYYWDGNLRKTVEGAWTGNASAGQIDKTYDGDVDELLFFDRALSAEEIASICNGTLPSPTRSTVSAELPTPIAHWDFNDAANLGKDVSGNGYHLTAVGTPTASTPADCYGSTFYSQKTGAYFKLDGDSLPEVFPQGKASFSVSLRVAMGDAPQGCDVISIGDVSKENSFFRIGTGNYPVTFGWDFAKTSGDTTKGVPYHPNSKMQHLVFSYDAEAEVVTVYRDGVKVPDSTASAVGNISAEGTIYVSYNPAKENKNFEGWIDDIQVFGCALTARQARLLTQTLGTDGVLNPALPAGSNVSIAKDATLAIHAAGSVAMKSLSGAGNLTLEPTATLSLSEMAAEPFTGTISGGGSVALPEGFVFNTDVNGAGLPAISATTGCVVLPASAVVRFDSPVADLADGTKKVYTLVSAGELSGATDFSAWTVEPQSDRFKKEFFIENGALKLRIKSGGSVLIFR